MKLTIKKISEEKIERIITDGDIIVFQDTLLHSYMEKYLINKELTLDMISQLSGLFGEFTEIENEFDI